METATIFSVLLTFAYLNAYAAIIGVQQRIRGGMRLYANDAGFYIPRHWGVEGFYRGLYINLLFGASSTALTALIVPGEPFRSAKALALLVAIVNLALSFVVACTIPSEFRILVYEERRRLVRTAAGGIVVGAVYGATAILVGRYMGSLP